MRWDRGKLPKPDSHVYGENGAKFMVYNMKRNPKIGGGGVKKKKQNKSKKKESSRKIIVKGKTSYLGSDYSG